MFAAEYADMQVDFEVHRQVLKARWHNPEKHRIRKPILSERVTVCSPCLQSLCEHSLVRAKHRK